jgi:ubiquinone/menaquinone biosynthesis C-methylase UbiE
MSNKFLGVLSHIFNALRIFSMDYQQDFEEFTSLTPQQAKVYLKGTENQRIRSVIAEIVGEDTVLEVGCGNGIDASRYKPDQYVGIDISKALVEEAENKHPLHKFYVMDGRVISEKDNSFDFVYCKAVLEHVPSEEDALKIFKEMLRVGKIILVAWHTPPKYEKTKIIRCRGHFGKTIYQNHYAKDLFNLSGIKIDKLNIDNYELWIVKK